MRTTTKRVAAVCSETSKELLHVKAMYVLGLLGVLGGTTVRK